MARRPTEVIDIDKVIPSKDKPCIYCGWRWRPKLTACPVCGYLEDVHDAYFPDKNYPFTDFAKDKRERYRKLAKERREQYQGEY
jgi:hypothetical protein